MDSEKDGEGYTYVAPAYLMIALSTDNLSNDVLAADEVLFHVDTLHNVSPEGKQKQWLEQS